MNPKIKLYEAGLEQYPGHTIVLGNLIMALWIALGTIACWFISPLAGWIYLVVALAMVGVVLRKLVCTDCYYYGRWCGTGWGKLAALLFRRGDINNFSRSAGVKIAPATYGLLSLIPLVMVTIALIQEFTAVKLAVLATLLMVSFYSGVISRGRGCRDCKMRLVCPGCAGKTPGK